MNVLPDLERVHDARGTTNPVARHGGNAKEKAMCMSRSYSHIQLIMTVLIQRLITIVWFCMDVSFDSLEKASLFGVRTRAAAPCSISPSLGPFSLKYLLQVDAGSELCAAIILLEWEDPCSQETRQSQDSGVRARQESGLNLNSKQNVSTMAFSPERCF